MTSSAVIETSRAKEGTAVNFMTTGRSAATDLGESSDAICDAARRLFTIHPALAGLLNTDQVRRMRVGELLDALELQLPDDHPARPHLRSIPGTLLSEQRTVRARLSVRELEVVRLIAEGLSNKEISRRLEVSDKTVKNHISHILAKLKLTARTQVAILALRGGIL